jgi:hypothetical protein
MLNLSTIHARTDVGLLDDLKKQAEQLRTNQGQDAAALQANIDATELACQMVFKYWIELAKQLSVIKPISKGRYTFDSRLAVFEGLQFTNFRADVRTRDLHSRQVSDNVTLFWDLRTGKEVRLTLDFPSDIERLEARIRQAGVRCIPDVVRNHATSKIVEVHYEFVADMQAQVRMRAYHEEARVEFELDNLDGLNHWVIRFDAAQINTALLDELAKWLLGQAHQFRDKGKLLEIREL